MQREPSPTHSAPAMPGPQKDTLQSAQSAPATAPRTLRRFQAPALFALGLLVLLGATAAAPAAHADNDDKMRTLRVQLAADDASSLRLDVPVGEVRVEGNDGDRVSVRVDLKCSRPVTERCERMVREVELDSANTESVLQVELDGWPKKLNNAGLSADVHVDMPRGLALRADLGVGEFETVGLVADLDLDIGVGEATIRAQEASVRRVDLEVGVGEAVLRLRDQAIEGSGFIGRELAWSEGPGRAALKVDCGVGEVDVQLDEE